VKKGLKKKGGGREHPLIKLTEEKGLGGGENIGGRTKNKLKEKGK